MPANVIISHSSRHGATLVSEGGRTLYARDANRFGGGGATHSDRTVARGDPATGRRIGLGGCDFECENKWPPFLAPRPQNRLGSEPLWSAVTERSNGPTADFHSTPILAMRGRVLRVVTISTIFMRMSRPMTLRLQQVRRPYTGGSRCPSGFPQHWRREVARAEH